MLLLQLNRRMTWLDIWRRGGIVCQFSPQEVFTANKVHRYQRSKQWTVLKFTGYLTTYLTSVGC